MATRSNTGVAEHDAERGVVEGVRPPDTSHSTRFVRDITYKAIPFCAFCLVVFSAGAILVSTLAFNKPIPHKSAIVVSTILLSFFLLFCTGSMYLYFRKFHPHVSKSSGLSRRRSYSDSHVWDYLKSFISRMVSHAGEIDGSAPQSGEGVQGGRIPTDTLRDPAPSPDAYIRETEQQGAITPRQNAVHELEELETQQNPQLPQQQRREPQGDRGDHPLRPDGLETNQAPNGRGRNGPIPTHTTRAFSPNQANSHPNPLPTQGNATDSPRRRNLPQSPSLVRNQYHVAGPREYVRGRTQQQRTGERSRDMHRQGYSGQIPTIRIEAPPERPFPPLPDSIEMRPRRLRDSAAGEYTRDIELQESRTENSERRRRDNPGDDPLLAHAPIAGPRKSSTQERRESLQSAIQYYGYF